MSRSEKVHTMPSAPAWYVHGNDWKGPVPGLPSFVTLPWIEEWHDVPLSIVRRIHESVARGEGIKAPTWWPSRVPPAGEIPYLLAMSLGDPEFFASLLRKLVKLSQGKQSSLRPSFFSQLLAYYETAEAERSQDYIYMVLFANLVEIPDEATLDVLGIAPERSSELKRHFAPGTNGRSLLEWMDIHFPVPAEHIRSLIQPDAPPAAEQRADPAAAETAPPAVEAAAAPAPETAAEPDQDEEALGRAVLSALAETRDRAAAAIAASPPDRSAVRPVVEAALAAARGARRLEHFLGTPIDIGELFPTLTAASEAIFAATKKVGPAVPAAPFLVTRPAAAGLRPLAETLSAGVTHVESLLEQARNRANDIHLSGDLDIVNEVVRLRNEVIALAEALSNDLGTAVGLVESGKAAPPKPRPVRTAPAPRPTDAPRAEVPSVVDARPAPEARPAPQRHYLAPGDHHASASVDLGPANGEAFDTAMRLCFSYLGQWLPDATFDEPTFTFENEDHGTVAYAVEAGEGVDRAWACILRKPDAGQANRTWTLETSLATVDGNLFLSVAMSTSAPGGTYPGHRSLPDIVPSALDILGGYDAGRALKASPTALANIDEFDALVMVAKRALPVVAVSLTTAGEGPQLSIDVLAQRLAGLAHVVTVPDHLSRELGRKHGNSWSVYNKAVRVYRPGANTATDDASRHVKHQADHIASTNSKATQGNGQTFEDMFCDTLLMEFPRFVGPTFAEVDTAAASTASHVAEIAAGPVPDAAEVAAINEAHAREMEATKLRMEEMQARLDSLGLDFERVMEERNDVLAQVNVQRARADGLHAALKGKGASTQATAALAPTDPKTVEELCRFAENELGPHVFVMPRAIKETAKARNVNVERLHKGLVSLRDVYVPMRLGKMTREECEKELKRTGFIESKVTSDPNKNHNTVPWGRDKVTLDRHLKWGTGTSLTSMFRIYFFWDEKEHQVVIGHMPTHFPD